MSAASQQRGGLAGVSRRWWGFAPQLFALQADWLSCHQSGCRHVMGGSLLQVAVVDVAADEEGDLTDLLTGRTDNG